MAQLIINNKKFDLKSENVAVINKKIYDGSEVIVEDIFSMIENRDVLTIRIEGGLVNLMTDENVSCGGNIYGSVISDGHVSVQGNVEGNVNCDGSMTVDTVYGNVTCDGNLVIQNKFDHKSK